MRFASLSAGAGVVVALAACGGDGGGAGAGDVLDRAGRTLGELRSADLRLRLTAEADGAPGQVGFELDGPLALGDPPVGRVRYVQLAGRQEGSLDLLLTRSGTFAEIDGQAYRLPAGQARPVREAAKLRSLDLEGLVREPKAGDGPRIDGVETRRVTGELDVAAMLRDVLGARTAGKDAERLQRTGKGSRFEMLAGREDGRLRRLRLDVRLGAGLPAEVRRRLGTGEGARLRFALDLAKLDGKVQVQTPRDALPASRIPRS